MKTLTLFLLIFSCSLWAEDQKTLDTFLLDRTGFYTDTGKTTYRYSELFTTYGKWIPLDVYYVDFGRAKTYRETAVGGGMTLFTGKHITLMQEVYFTQASGPDAHSTRYLQPWTGVFFQLTKKVGGEAVYLPYIPLNKAGTVQHVIERAKLEYDFGKWKLGGGYAAYRFGDGPWQNKPMITTTLKTRAGSFEFWLQKMPGGAQVQVRYSKMFKGHKDGH